MFDVAQIVTIRRRLTALASAFDAAALSASAANEVLAHAAAMKSMLASIEAAAAARVAESDVWRRDGDRTPAHHLARVAGTSVGSARRTLETADQLARLPATAAAARRGEVSPHQAEVIADAAVVAPHAESELLDAARRGTSLAELRSAAEAAKAAALDAEERHRRAHAARALRRRTCGDGSAELTYRSTPEEVAQIWAVAERYAEESFAAARADGRRESHEAYLADGLLAATRAASGRGGRKAGASKVIVRIDWTALVRGAAVPGETCEVAGIGPVPVSVVREMIESGDAFLAAVVTRGVDVVNVAHLGRRPTVVQQTALEWRQPQCTVLGCSATNVQIDHREEWCSTHHTLLGELDPLCRHHHHLKTTQGWKLVDGTGTRRMVPPGDPDHPDRESRPPP